MKAMKINTENLDLWSVEAEAAVLGSMIIDRSCVDKVVSILPAEDTFFDDRHSKIYAALLRLRLNNEPTDGVALRTELKKANQLDNVGGAEYIAEVIDSVPSSANAEYYAKIVRDKYRYRILISGLDKMQGVINNPIDVNKQVRLVQDLALGLEADGIFTAPLEASTTCLADVTARNVEWLWPDRIPLGSLSMLAGNPGLGKSLITMMLAAHVTGGLSWPDTPRSEIAKGSVILLNGEDNLSDTVRPRLDAAGADVNKVFSIDGVQINDEDGRIIEDMVFFNIDQHIAALRNEIERRPDTRLVIVDPISSFMGKADGHKDTDVRRVLTKLASIAETYKVAVVFVKHLNKAKGTSANFRIMGSVGFWAAARTVWHIAQDPDSETNGTRVFLPGKNNLTAEQSGLTFRLEPVRDDGRVDSVRAVFDSEPDYRTIDDVLNENESTDRQSPEQDKVVDFLQEVLSQGAKKATEVWELIEVNKFKPATVKRAKAAAGVISKRIDGQWEWSLKN